jgi:hypothetical protein
MVGDSLPLPEDINVSSFRNVIFTGDLEFRMMDEVHKFSDNENPLHSSKVSSFDKIYVVSFVLRLLLIMFFFAFILMDQRMMFSKQQYLKKSLLISGLAGTSDVIQSYNVLC